MIIISKGGLYIIKDGEGKLVEKLDIKDEKVMRGVFAGYKYYIIKVWIKLEER